MRNHLRRTLLHTNKSTANLVTQAHICKPVGIALAAGRQSTVSTSCAASHSGCQRAPAFLLLGNDPGMLGPWSLLRGYSTALLLCDAPGESLGALGAGK